MTKEGSLDADATSISRPQPHLAAKRIQKKLKYNPSCVPGDLVRYDAMTNAIEYAALRRDASAFIEYSKKDLFPGDQ